MSTATGRAKRCIAADLGSSLPPHLLNSGGDCGAGLRSSLALPCHASMQNAACLATKVCQVIDDNLNEEEQIRIPARPAPVEGDVLQIRAWCGRRRRQLQNMSFPSLSFSPSFAVSFSPVRPCVTPSPPLSPSLLFIALGVQRPLPPSSSFAASAVSSPSLPPPTRPFFMRARGLTSPDLHSFLPFLPRALHYSLCLNDQQGNPQGVSAMLSLDNLDLYFGKLSRMDGLSVYSEGRHRVWYPNFLISLLIVCSFSFSPAPITAFQLFPPPPPSASLSQSLSFLVLVVLPRHVAAHAVRWPQLCSLKHLIFSPMASPFLLLFLLLSFPSSHLALLPCS